MPPKRQKASAKKSESTVASQPMRSDDEGDVGSGNKTKLTRQSSSKVCLSFLALIELTRLLLFER
jgi:hypothetical protein